MKLNKVEKIVITVILLGVILIGGTFMFVVPSFNQIGANGMVLAANIVEREELDLRLSRLDTIDADIDSQKKNAITYEGHFYPDLTNYEASEIAMALLKDSGLDTHAITINPITTEEITLEAFLYPEVTYTLKDYSAAAKEETDENKLEEGQFMEGGKKYTAMANSVTEVVITDEAGETIDPSKYTDKMKWASKMALCKFVASSNLNQVVGVTKATYTVKGKYIDYKNFIDHIYSLDRATSFQEVIYPVTMTISNEDEDKDEDEPSEYFIDEGGTLRTKEEAAGKETFVEDDTIVSEDVTIIFMSVEPMEEVKTLNIDGTNIVVDQDPVIY